MTQFFSIKTLGDLNNDKLVYIEDYVVGLEMFDWRTKFGHSTKKEWPPDAKVVLRKTSGRKLTDLLGTTKNTLFVSPSLREAFEQHCRGVDIEYLPFELRDPRDRLVSKDYVIVNPLGTVDCLDLDASEILWDEDEPGKALNVIKIVLSAKKLKNTPPLFRIAEKPATYIINSETAKDLQDRKFTNVLLGKVTVK